MAKKTTKKSMKKTTKKTTKKMTSKTMKKATKKTHSKSARAAITRGKAKAGTKLMKKSAAPRHVVVKTPAMPAHSQVLVGQSVPAFELQATGQKRVSLNGLRGQVVVLYFYPKDATPGCTLEGHDFTRLHNQFKELGVEVYGVSRDSLNSHEKFKTKECYSIDLLSDENEELSNTFGVIKMKNMYGKQVRGIERSTFVIDRDGRLVKEWRGVSVPGHAEEVLNFVRTL